MQTLSLDPPVPLLLPPDVPIQVILVGAGGTGSHILQSLARLATHAAGQGRPPSIVVIDGDTVEHKNVGRQLFSTADVGLNKAQCLAARFGEVFGLPIAAVPRMADAVLLSDLRERSVLTILVGAVDTPAARHEIHETLRAGAARIWLDAGNEESAGQVCVGTTTDPKKLNGSLALGLCRDLPAPSLLYPNLIAAPKVARRGDCAAQMEANTQGLMVNQAIAAVAAQYLHDLILSRRLTTFETTISLSPPAMRSRAITAAQLAEATGLPASALTNTPESRVKPKKGRRAA